MEFVQLWVAQIFGIARAFKEGSILRMLSVVVRLNDLSRSP